MYNPKLSFFNSNGKSPRGSFVSEHSHSCYELVYCHKADGTLSLGNRVHTLKNGSIQIIYPQSAHSENHFSDTVISFLGFECPNFPKNILRETVYNIPQHYSVCDIIDKIVREASEQQTNHSELISCMLSEIILLLERYVRNDEQSVKSLDYVSSYITEYCNQPIDFESLAKTLGYSIDHFRHIFTHKFGMSPKQFQIDVRLRKSADMLINTEHTCTDIAAACGFSTSSQFSKMFLRKYNISPLEFRQNRKKIT